jgi:hypothetical protein
LNDELTEAARWSEYFDSLAPNGEQVIATVQLLGQQVSEVNGIQSLLREITYDIEENVLEVALGGQDGGRPALRYFVFSPTAISVEESNGATTILVRDGARELTLIRLVRAPRSRPLVATAHRGASSRADAAVARLQPPTRPPR